MHPIYPNLLPNLCQLGTIQYITQQLSQEFNTRQHTTCGKAPRNINVSDRYCPYLHVSAWKDIMGNVDCVILSSMYMQLVHRNLERHPSLISLVNSASHTYVTINKTYEERP